MKSVATEVAADPSTEDEPPNQLETKGIISQFEYIKSSISKNDFLAVTREFPFITTFYYLSLAQPQINDPILRQLCPSVEELKFAEGVFDDPLEEERDSPVSGLVHRYPDRVLMVVTNCCFMNCRHCTRKRLWKSGRWARPLSEIDDMLDYIRRNPKIRDVIVSGGDPLTFSDARLDIILGKIRQIPHVEIIRIGSRAPVVYPQRITAALVEILKKYRPLWLNTQFNHAREITPESSGAIQKILEAGIQVNNQTVLLKGINDNAETMLALCQGLLKIGVRPYYLFHCDPVKGVGHFRTPISRGMDIIEKMRGHTSGLAVPTFVVDAIDGGGKIPLQPRYIVGREGDRFVLRNYKGDCFAYDAIPA
jgi:lysine 2,3-aminomutase